MRPADDGILRTGLLVLGIAQLALGLFMVVAPGAFFTELGPFGVRNDHYIRDNASWELALAAVAFAAVAWRSWRVPVLAVAAVHYALHAVNHLVDVDEATPAWVGVADLVLLALGAGLLAVLWRRADNQESTAAITAGKERP